MSSIKQRSGLQTDLTSLISNSVFLLVHLLPFESFGRYVQPIFISFWLRIRQCLSLWFFSIMMVLRIVHWNAEGVRQKKLDWTSTVPKNAKNRRLLHPGDSSQQYAQILHPRIWNTPCWPSRRTHYQHTIHRGSEIIESWHGIHHREAHSPRKKPGHLSLVQSVQQSNQSPHSSTEQWRTRWL